MAIIGEEKRGKQSGDIVASDATLRLGDFRLEHHPSDGAARVAARAPGGRTA